MSSLRLLCAFAITAALYPGQLRSQIPTLNPELTEGPWETATPFGIDGIFMIMNTGFNSQTGSSWQTVNIRVYHRESGKETWGYFATTEKATPQPYNLRDGHSFTLFDGSRLRIHLVDNVELRAFDLDVTFSARSHQWAGTWSRRDQPSNVILQRPQPKPGVTPNPFVGDWTTASDKTYLAVGSLLIRESSDGTLCAWLNRVVASSDRRNGEFLIVHSATPPELHLEFSGGFGPDYHYRGSLSADGQTLAGEWGEVSDARLNAPEIFRRLTNQSYSQ